MRLTNIAKKIKEIGDLPKNSAIFLIIALALVGLLVAQKLLAHDLTRKGELRIVSTNTQRDAVEMYIGAISGTSYYLPWCEGVKRIHAQNKRFFTSREEAETMGYKPAKNCKGI